MSDWQVGDLAVCVDARSDRYFKNTLSEGRVYTVVAVFGGLGGADLYPDERTGLLLGETMPPVGADFFAAARFRKIRPDEHEACEEEFVTLLKRSKQTVKA